jgi:hypothetical protein
MAHDENYYELHPKKLQQKINECDASKQTEQCQKLKLLAIQMNQLAYTLQRNPQEFGQKVMKIQEDIANLEAKYKVKPKDKKLSEELAKSKRKLGRYLAIVRWLESPES